MENKSSQNQTIESLIEGFQNPRIIQLITTHPSINTLLTTKSKPNLLAMRSYLSHIQQRKWLCKKGKKYLIDFDQKQRRQMKQYFNALDKSGKGSIGIDQLQQFLISVGLAENRQQVKALIDSVDEDKSGKIQFQQFLSMIQNNDGPTQKIVTFFKNVINQDKKKYNTPLTRSTTQRKQMRRTTLNQQLIKSKKSSNLPFEMLVSKIRRNHLINALNIKNQNYQSQKIQEDQAKGQVVMNALKKMWERKMLKKIKQDKIKQIKLKLPPASSNA